MRVAVLWTGLSGYMNACLKELASREDVELFVSHSAPQSDAPYDELQFAWIKNRFTWRSDRDLDVLDQQLDAFAPDVIVFGGWHVSGYRRVAKELSGKCWRVMATDRCWLGTLKQRIGTWVAPFYVRPLADAIWVPGDRQAAFARKLGFDQKVILRGIYTCDQPAIENIHLSRISEGRTVPRSFLFVGRFVPEKGIDLLVKAYQAYRESNSDPWPLICRGSGPQRTRLEGKPGILVEGFVQPEHIPEVLASAGCLVLPSLFEPWALVVHEAASAGMAILASENVGAIPHLVQGGYNGFIFGTRNAKELADLMSRMSAMSDVRLDEMSRASFLLSRQFSPKRWADTLLESFNSLSGHSVAGSRTVAVR